MAAPAISPVTTTWLASSIVLWALIANDCTFAVDVFVSRELAQRALADALADEPSWVDLLEIGPIHEPSVHELALATYRAES